MSRNYDLLKHAERAQELFAESSGRSGNGHGKPALMNGNGRPHEEILKLIQRTFLSSTGPTPRFVVFSAVDHGSGSSLLCTRAAEALASNVEGSVCVVDANLRSPALYRYFGIPAGTGLREAILKQESMRSFAQVVGDSNLHLISGSSSPSTLKGVMSPERVKTRFAELCAEFDYVLVDAPPIGYSADSMMLGQIADGVILVLAANSTRREAARRAKESLESANVRILGAVLNKRTMPIPEGLYHKL